MSDRESRAKEANSAGHEAFREGKAREANPHPLGTLAWWAWDLGFRSEKEWAAMAAAGVWPAVAAPEAAE